MSLVLTAYTYMHMYRPAADSVSITITHQNRTVLASLGPRPSRTCVWLGSGHVHETKFWQDAVGHYELDRDRLRQCLCAIASRGHGDGVEIDWSGV